MEIWKDIEGYEGSYQVSDLGQVRSLDRQTNGGWMKGQILKPFVHPLGYHQYRLYDGGFGVTKQVHTLVGKAFLTPKSGDDMVLHGPNGVSDNSVSNLSWGTAKQNALDRTRDGTNHQALKTHCPREHILSEPNLQKGKLKKGLRDCLACSRARGYIGQHKDLNLDYKELADEYYQKIMKYVIIEEESK